MQFISLLLVAALALHTKAQYLLYNPTNIFLSPTDSDLAYIFISSTSSPQSQLASLNISASLKASNLSLNTLTSNLPFLEGDSAENRIAYIPSISASGFLGVYAGSCAASSSFWIFYPSSDKATQTPGNGTWREMSVIRPSSLSTSILPSANFLASSFSFSTLIDSNDTQRTVYNFGGMCPTSFTTNASTLQSSANYSNNMLKLSSSSATSYQLSLSDSTSNRPIAEAGFTVTALAPTFSNASSGIMTQAQNFVLLGGHTKTAFINMSQVALFSLPQESWSFQSIDSAVGDGTTELAVKSTASTKLTAPDPRSGHTAVLSSDGSSIIVFGGWVGDTSTAAEPQLAVLHTGSGFGGTGNWAWDLPRAQGTGLPAGEGLYGHGAAMLSGDVMVVIGGYRIAPPGSGKTSKRSDAGTGAYFLNITSMTWLSEYTNPSYNAITATSSTNSASSDASSNSKKVGLGAGLGLGLAAVIGALIVYFWYSRRLQKRREEARERDLQELSQNGTEYYANHSGFAGTRNPGRANWWAGTQIGEMTQREALMPLSASESSNLGTRGMGIGAGSNGGYVQMVHAPSIVSEDYNDNVVRSAVGRTDSNGSGYSIPRKPINTRNARGYYQPTPSSSSSQSYSGFDFGTGHSRANSLGTAGVIHPIYEADEDLEASAGHNPNPDPTGSGRVGQAIGDYDSFDPFLDPPASSQISPTRSNAGSRQGTGYDQYRDRATPSPESSAQEREREIKEWVADWAAADALLNSRAQSLTYNGGISPSKESGSGRTESNLSERSLATVSALALSRSGSIRNNSLTAFFASGSSSWNPFATSSAAAAALGSIHEHGNGDVSPISDHSSGHGLQRGPRPPPSADSGTSPSFRTAHTSQSFPALRAEAERLLPRPDEQVSESSPSKAKAAAFSRRQQGGWLGSLKRVLIRGEEDGSSSGSARSSPTRGHRSPSLSNSPTRIDHGVVGPGPRRTASATATMWRRKQGKDDWEDSAEPTLVSERSNTLTLDGSWKPILNEHLGEDGHEEEEEEWDIERAVERRVVQVMFTVPKEKLRVVNHDVKVDGDESEAESVKGIIVDAGHEDIVMEKEEPMSRPHSPGKGKGRVQEIVDKMEKVMK